MVNFLCSFNARREIYELDGEVGWCMLVVASSYRTIVYVEVCIYIKKKDAFHFKLFEGAYKLR